MDVNSKEAAEWMDSMRQSSEREARLPKHERSRLERLSVSDLVAGIERCGFECEGAPLINFTEWTELKERIANYEPPDPPGFEGGFADNH